jgi:transposase-like protein
MQKHERKTRCWACSSLFVQRWGKQLGRQRFKCNHCGIYFTSENPGVKQNNELIWFRNWVIERQTLSSYLYIETLHSRTPCSIEQPMQNMQMRYMKI